MKSHLWHLEITSRCTLCCPRCPRTMRVGDYPVTDLPVSAVETLVASQAFQSCRVVNLCGNLGDPVFHRDFHAILRVLKGAGVRVVIFTAGSHRSTEWWQTVLDILEPRDKIVFAVDGLEDTNPIYRVRSRWDDIMTALRVCGGRVETEWAFIPMRHNEHQIAEAQALAESLGASFRLNLSDRFGPPFWTDLESDPFLPTDLTLTRPKLWKKFERP